MRMTCFGDLPTTALLIVHNTLLDEDNQYAAKFRCSCRAAHEGATLPPLLKVAFPLPPLKHTLSSLARLLHHPSKAKSTSLSVKIDDLNGKDLDDVLECLQAVSDHLTHLDLPVEPYTPSIRTMVSAVCKYLPQVQHLQLQLDRSTEEQDLVALVWLNHGGISIREADVNEGQLSTLVLRRAPGEQPFCFLGTTTPPLDLSLTPTLSHLVLQGPIVQDAKKYPGQTSLVLPPHTKVTIDPGLEGRAPTCWARNITVFDRFSDMPRDAIPDVETYREEDLDQRMLRVWAFTEDLIDFTVERKKTPNLKVPVVWCTCLMGCGVNHNLHHQNSIPDNPLHQIRLCISSRRWLHVQRLSQFQYKSLS
ncbi:hypothetical protein DUNSADRAFT_8036 [Dunaliella salina]|uniref:Encoded protein n=1 Tax=Dunaliella salina TaxID=3046 RepID=A0ABQ7GKB9_DUNSA|nr:hypothetical protein DUNSADRAFT_8036 [Dunaliella salina]KAF5835033.1 hypothetical protein DUNSADRAFT_8036 [Dunaliella salina]|eukprot:KAF5835030.1 hypothetical protein DUNSADRAFT_8036 [Dunaliella salina]